MSQTASSALPKIVRKNEAEVESVGSKTHFWYSKPGLTDTERLNYVRVVLPPGEGHDFHYHPMEEVLHVLSGMATQWIEGEKHLLGPGDAVHVPEGVVHATYNSGEVELEFIAVLIPDNVSYQGGMTGEVGSEEPWASIERIKISKII